MIMPDDIPTSHTTDKSDNTSSTDDTIQRLREGKKAHDEFAKRFREQYLIANKSTEEWKEYFKLTLPPDLNTHTCQEMDTQIMELYQEASFLKAEVEARLTAYKNTNSDRYRARYAQLVSEYEKKGQRLPARDTLAVLAETVISSSSKGAIVHAEIELAFWKEILSSLGNSRKLIENVTMNLNIEAKALQTSFYLDKLNTSR
jgi:DNA gyrase/topoisomerase IV subunit B